MSWLQISINTTKDHAELAEDCLFTAGAQTVTLTDAADQPILEPGPDETPVWNTVIVTGLFNFDNNQQSLLDEINHNLANISYSCTTEILEDQNWTRAWMEHFHAMQFGERLWVCPLHIEPPEPEMINLRLDPGLAFGTGTHPTTSLCLRWLDQNIGLNSKAQENILDYGCGTGEFLFSMKKSSWSVSGIEPNAIVRKIALEDYMLDVKDEPDFERVDSGSLDVITLWHVLEHIYPIHERLVSFSEKLKDDGILIAAVPNMKSLDARKYGRYWAAWDVPRHIHHFDRASIEFLFKAHGFQLISVRPMLLDAFYISMLSEKYKFGSSNILKAFLKGLQSNTSAFLNTGNYSSLIYIFKKSN